MIKASTQRVKYVACDYLASNLAWFVFNIVRYVMGGVRGFDVLQGFLTSPTVLLGQFLLPLVMMVVYYLSGYYNVVLRKSRLSELTLTFSSAAVNTLIVFVVTLINDMDVDSRALNYETILVLFGLLFVFTYSLRAMITSHTSSKIKHREWSSNTLIIGAGSSAVSFVQKIERMTASMGYNVVGYVEIPGENRVKEIEKPVYQLDDVGDVCKRHKVEELIVVPTKKDTSIILEAINQLFSLNLPIKITPDRYNILLSRARLSDMYGDPLVDISSSNMSECGKNVKRMIDVVASLVMLVLLLPVYATVAAIIKRDSKGPVFYTQPRIGRHNKVFHIIKFRSMVQDAESMGKPQLSAEDDPRVTRVGRVLRKYRIDELPQFWNVLRGDMSLVGPRPERQFYVDQIIAREPAYSLVHQIRPGITSLGMVKFGYARNVDEMVERLRYDLIYLENMSLINDLKIIAYTFKIVINGRGM